MDILYYNNQVKEELDGAMDYIKKAIMLKKDHPTTMPRQEIFSTVLVDLLLTQVPEHPLVQ